MPYTHPHNEKRTEANRSTDDTSRTGDTGALPPEPNPEHPKHDREGAHRTFKRLKSTRWTSDDLTARQYGLIAYWYPWLVPSDSEGGD